MLVDLLHLLHKDLPVLSHLDGGHRGAQHFHLVLLQDALLGQLHAAVQGRLAAEGQQHAVGTLVLDHLPRRRELPRMRAATTNGGAGKRTATNLSDIFCRDGQEVDLVSQALRGLDRSDVGVDEHRLDVLLLQSLDGLK